MENKQSAITIQWPNGSQSHCSKGDDWLGAAQAAGIHIPTGCLGGSCGACEIEVNGQVGACLHQHGACITLWIPLRGIRHRPLLVTK